MKKAVIQQKQASEASSADCECQILLDTSLSQVSDKDCSCSDCLEANLDAFNDFKAESNPKDAKQTQRRYISSSKNQNRLQGRNQSESRLKSQTINKGARNQQSEADNEEKPEGQDSGLLLRDYEDYMMITRHRTRKYLEDRKKLQQEETLEKEQLKRKIKENLQMLRYTAVEIRSKDNSALQHKFKWNHQPYICCGRKNLKQSNQGPASAPVEAKKVNTNLHRILDPAFEANRDKILSQKKRARLQQMKSNEHYDCPDQCPNHHLRTSPTKLKQIEARIKAQAEAYQKKLAAEKERRVEKVKAKDAKLRAIDIKCRDILAKSKKYDPNSSRTSFHNSVDHFSTFSEMRQTQADKQKQKKEASQREQIVQKQPGKLIEAIYEEIEEHQPREAKLNLSQKNVSKKRLKQAESQVQTPPVGFYEPIVKEANISSPKQKNGQDQAARERKAANAARAKKEQELEREEKRKKELQAEIEQKKLELMQEYKKRNTVIGKQPKNKQIRQDYEQPGMKVTHERQEGPSKDPYRSNYRHQPGKELLKMEIHGHPVEEEYGYHCNVKKAQEAKLQLKEVYTKNSQTLLRQPRVDM